ncbi:hypothetical protein ACFL5O_05030 [Myxococcota bacterium]
MSEAALPLGRRRPDPLCPTPGTMRAGPVHARGTDLAQSQSFFRLGKVRELTNVTPVSIAASVQYIGFTSYTVTASAVCQAMVLFVGWLKIL